MGFVSDSFRGRSRISVWIGRFAQWLLIRSLDMAALSSQEEVALSCGGVPGPRESLSAVLSNR